MTTLYRTKVRTGIVAVRWFPPGNPQHTPVNDVQHHSYDENACYGTPGAGGEWWSVTTVDGNVCPLSTGQWILWDDKGFPYPCDNMIFQARYEPDIKVCRFQASNIEHYGPCNDDCFTQPVTEVLCPACEKAPRNPKDPTDHKQAFKNGWEAAMKFLEPTKEELGSGIIHDPSTARKMGWKEGFNSAKKLYTGESLKEMQEAMPHVTEADIASVVLPLADELMDYTKGYKEGAKAGAEAERLKIANERLDHQAVDRMAGMLHKVVGVPNFHVRVPEQNTSPIVGKCTSKGCKGDLIGTRNPQSWGGNSKVTIDYSKQCTEDASHSLSMSLETAATVFPQDFQGTVHESKCCDHTYPYSHVDPPKSKTGAADQDTKTDHNKHVSQKQEISVQGLGKMIYSITLRDIGSLIAFAFAVYAAYDFDQAKREKKTIVGVWRELMMHKDGILQLLNDRTPEPRYNGPCKGANCKNWITGDSLLCSECKAQLKEIGCGCSKVTGKHTRYECNDSCH